MTLGLGLVLLAAVLTGMLVTPVVIRLAVGRGAVDVPVGGRRIHTRAVPRLGGISVCVSTVIGLLLASSLQSVLDIRLTPPQLDFFLGLLIGGGMLFVVGLIDDLWTLRPSVKLAVQVAAALVVYAFGFRVDVISLGASTEIALGVFALPCTVLWVVGVTNAFNLIDGLDGLATGVALVALTTTAAVAFVLGRVEVVVVSIALIGSLVGFLRYNFNPARIFLGDSGSLVVGFMLAVLSVHGSQMSATAVLAIVPLFALALPLLDTALTMVRRWLRGVPLSEADARHIHHQLLAVGLTHRRAVFVLYAISSGLAIVGLSVVLAPPALVAGIAVVGGIASVVLLGFALRHLQYHEFAEAGAVLLSGVLRIRRVIGDQIHARDIAHVLARTRSLDEVNAVLEDSAANFGFLHVEVCREGALGRVRFNGHGARAWKLDYPVVPSSVDHDPYVLRIWCHSGDGFRPYGAERVAGVLAPAIEEWMLENEPDLASILIMDSGLAAEAIGMAVDGDSGGRGRLRALPTSLGRRGA